MERSAELAVRLIERVTFGSDRSSHRQQLALAELLLMLLRAERGGMREARSVTVILEAKVSDLVTAKINQAARAADDVSEVTIAAAGATATAEMDASYATALAVVTAMGLSAARTTTLTNMLIAMRDANKASATAATTTATTAAATASRNAATQAANESGLKLLNEAQSWIRNGITGDGGIVALTATIDELKLAIETEGERLGIRI